MRSVSVLRYTVSPKWRLRHACTFNQPHLTEWLMPLSTSQTLVSVLLLNLLPVSLFVYPLLSEHLGHYNMMQHDANGNTGCSFWFEFLLLNVLIQPPLSLQLLLSFIPNISCCFFKPLMLDILLNKTCNLKYGLQALQLSVKVSTLNCAYIKNIYHWSWDYENAVMKITKS